MNVSPLIHDVNFKKITNFHLKYTIHKVPMMRQSGERPAYRPKYR